MWRGGQARAPPLAPSGHPHGLYMKISVPCCVVCPDVSHPTPVVRPLRARCASGSSPSPLPPSLAYVRVRVCMRAPWRGASGVLSLEERPPALGPGLINPDTCLVKRCDWRLLSGLQHC